MPRLLFALCCLLGSLIAGAAPLQVPHATVELVAANATARPGQSLLVALRLQHEPEWHTYWKNPGDSGMPTRIDWKLPEGVQAGPILWPVPRRIPVGPLANYGYENELLLLTEIRLPSAWPAGRRPLALAARAEWLICKEVCIPGGTDLALDIPVGPKAVADPVWAARLDAARAALPRPLTGWTPRALVEERHLVIQLDGPADAPAIDHLEFLPDAQDVVDNPAPQALERTPTGYRLLLTAATGFKGTIPALEGLLVARPGIGGAGAVVVSMPYPGGAPKAAAKRPAAGMSADDIRAAAGAPPASGMGLLVAMLFAFLGGIVLNLMPCVFPVVSIKVLGFVEQAHGDRADLRRHGLVFAAGIVVCFWAIAGLLLALRSGGEALGWGYQLQSPAIIAGLATLFFLLGLNLSGVFEMGARVQSLAGDVRAGQGLGGAFLSGLLATAVATPCTAPFMGAALGFALTQPALDAMLVFTALALGMAAPYVLLSFAPALSRRLPRPGRWMETLKQLLAFPLYLTVVWLVWVLGEQLGVTAAAKLLAGLVLIAAAIWAWRRFEVSSRALATTCGIVLVAAAAWIGWPAGEPKAATPPAAGWAPYSEPALATARAEGPVFVDFTAAWCVTCQVNKRVVLEREAVRRAFADAGVKLVRADWTNRDESITRALAALGRSGVPVYALYPAGGGTPELLPELLTQDLVLAALARLPARPR